MTRRSRNFPKKVLAPMETLPPPRDPELAVREEYELALKCGTVEAFQLFAVRHPEHRLATEAQKIIQRLRANGTP